MQLASKGQAVVTGYLGKDPEERTPPGKRLVELSIIVGKDKPKEGQQYGDTHWCNATIWGGYKAGDQMCDIALAMEKGDQLLVTGTVKVEQYTAKDGSQKESKRLNVDFIIPLGTAAGSTAGQEAKERFQDVSDDDETELPF